MVSCIRVQQLTVKCISGKPQTDSDKSVSKIYHSHSRNPAQGLTDAQRHLKQQKVPAVFKSDWLRRQRFTSANGGGGGGCQGEPGTHTAPQQRTTEHLHIHQQHSHWKANSRRPGRRRGASISSQTTGSDGNHGECVKPCFSTADGSCVRKAPGGVPQTLAGFAEAEHGGISCHHYPASKNPQVPRERKPEKTCLCTGVKINAKKTK